MFLLLEKFDVQLIQSSSLLLEKLIVPQLVKKFPAFYKTREFITVLQKPVTCPYYEPDQSTGRPTK
jgi:hypothetical protein